MINERKFSLAEPDVRDVLSESSLDTDTSARPLGVRMNRVPL